MQTFLSFLFTLLRGRALLIVCAWCVSVGAVRAQAPCPPMTVQSVTVNPLVGCHPGQYEVNINAVTQHNTYYAYLYAVGSTTAYTSVEVLGVAFDLEVFGSLSAGSYTLTVVPVSANMGALPQYAISSAPFAIAAARASNAPQVLSCAGVIDNNIVTSDAPTLPCLITDNIGVFNAKTLGGTDPKNVALRTAAIYSIVAADCLTDFAYLHYLYDKINANYLLRFRYTNSASARDVKSIDIIVDKTKLGFPASPPLDGDYNSTDYKKFVAVLEGFLSAKLKPLLPEPTKYLKITVSGL